MLPGIVPVREVVARADDAVVVLVAAHAYPQGCVLDVAAACRAGAHRGGQWLGHPSKIDVVMFSQHAEEALPDEVLRMGVQFADGRKATTLEQHRLRWHTERVSPRHGPVLVSLSGPSGVARDDLVEIHQRLWLWPQPPPEPFDFVVEWPAAGIALTRHRLDGTSIASAARTTSPYWPEATR